jgi:hypothetical protein
MPLSREEPMVDSAYPTGHALELARSATLAAAARPAAKVAGLNRPGFTGGSVA